MPSGRAIGIVTRAPTPGNVKTRLAAALGDAAAALLYAAFLRDALVGAASVPNAAITIFHPPEDDVATLAGLCPPGAGLRPEAGHGYGEILPAALRELRVSAPVAALVGADSPGLPDKTLRAAFEALESGSADVAICPTADGGFCVLAVNGDYPELLRDIDWSTARVYQQTVAHAERSGLRVAVLPEWYDVDQSEDLARLASDLAGDVTLGAAATRAALRRLRAAGVSVPGGQPPWRVESRQAVFTSPWRSLVADTVTTHTGAVIDYAYLETERAVWVVPVTDDGRVVLVRQYRHPVGEIILEVPAGGGNVDILALAARELREETGGRAREYIPIASFFPASAHTTHEGHVVLALGVELGAPDREETELLATVTVPHELAFDMARRGEIADSQSALALLAAEPAIRAAFTTA